MLAQSQEFNDNASNENTELCFYCRNYYTKDDFENGNKDKDTNKNNVCNKCYNEYLNLCKKLNVKFIERMRNQTECSGGYNKEVDHLDTYAIDNGKEIFIRGYVLRGGEYNFVHQERAEIFELKMQFLKSNKKWIRFYGNDIIDKINASRY